LDVDEQSAADWLAMDYLAHFTDRAGAWLQDREEWPDTWQVAGLEDHLVQVSAEQLTALRAELVEVLERYRRVGQGNPQAKRVVVYTCALPVDRPPG
ncbi:MAG: ArsR family transcriptional regulator, partial [Actinomycetota bacterium]|nr:ArsR family transcriptional regulator [Actinomycetota bacterium]